MADVSKIKLPNNNTYNIKDYRIPGVDTTPTSGSDNVVTSGGIYNSIKDFESFYFVQGSSSAAGNSTSGSYLSTKWEGTVPGVSTATNGLKIAYRIATNTGVSTAGVVLSIDGTNYYPVVIQKNTLVTSHYPVGTTVLMVFNSTQTATAYLTSNTKSTVTGCWQIMEYDSNSDTKQREYLSSDNVEYPITTRYATTSGSSYYAEYGRYSEGVTLNPSTNTITASAFKVDDGTSSQVLKADGSLGAIDSTPTANSSNLVTSGGVRDAIDTAIGSVYRVKGTKATYAELPSSGNVAGDVWNVTAAYGNYPAGTNWVWTGSAWDALGGAIDLSVKQDVLTFDSTPTANSTNPVTSGGIYNALNNTELVVSAALNDLNDRVVDLEDDLNDINSAGTLTTTSTTALSTETNESLSGNISLHKVAKTGAYSDLIGKPTIPDDKIFVVEFTIEQGQVGGEVEVSTTTTFSEIEAAVQAGKFVIGTGPSFILTLTDYEPDSFFLFNVFTLWSSNDDLYLSNAQIYVSSEDEVGLRWHDILIPSAPGTLDTTATTAQSTSADEALSGNITLHKVAKTGSYNDLLNKPASTPIAVEWDSNDELIFPNGVDPSQLPANSHVVLYGDGLDAYLIDSAGMIPAGSGELRLFYCCVLFYWYYPEDDGGEETYPASFIVEFLANTDGFYGIHCVSFVEENGVFVVDSDNPAYNRVLLNNTDKITEIVSQSYNDSYLPTAGAVKNYISGKTLPAVTSLDNGKVLTVSSGAWTAATIPTVPTISTNVVTDKASDTKTSSPKSVYDEIHPAVVTTQPAGGFAPNVLYNLGTLTGSVTFALATPADSSVVNHYYWTFDTGSTAPTITWPSGVSWVGGSAPTISASKHYEISILNNIGAYMEV